MSICDLVTVAADEYAKGAQDLVKFRKSIKSKFPNVPDDVVDTLFQKGAQRYRSDFRAVEDIKRQIGDTVSREAWKNRPILHRVGSTIVNVVGAGRGLIASYDLSAPGRQGAFLIAANPKMGLKSIPTMFQALGSEGAAQAMDAAIRTRRNASLYDKSGLYLAPLEDAPKLTGREEAFMTNLNERIPLGIGKGYRASERAYVTFLNKLRADNFDTLARDFEKRNGRVMNDEEAEAVSKFINAATGRGSLGSLERSSELLAATFFSPRFMASRVQLLKGSALPGGTFGGTAATSRLIARTYVQVAGSALAAYGLAKMAGAEIETDPRSSDFMKLRFGDTRVDLMAGMQQYVVEAARQITGTKKTQGGDIVDLAPGSRSGTRADEALHFARGKLAPLPSTAWDIAAGKNIIGEPVDEGGLANQFGADIAGSTAGVADYVATRNIVPMTYQDIKKTAEEEGYPLATAQLIANIFGIGVNTYHQ